MSHTNPGLIRTCRADTCVLPPTVRVHGGFRHEDEWISRRLCARRSRAAGEHVLQRKPGRPPQPAPSAITSGVWALTSESSAPRSYPSLAFFDSRSGPMVVTFPPRNEPLNFKVQLEAQYRDQLRRSAGSTFVDPEGDIVWTTEYLLYRLNLCGHADSVAKVMRQIDTGQLQALCGTAPAGVIPFPPPTKPADFRNQLEAKSRRTAARAILDVRRSRRRCGVDHRIHAVSGQRYAGTTRPCRKCF